MALDVRVGREIRPRTGTALAEIAKRDRVVSMAMNVKRREVNMDILHDFPINAPISRVYSAVTAPAGLDQWWTKKSSGKPARDAEYQLWFGPKFDWRAKVVHAVADKEF